MQDVIDRFVLGLNVDPTYEPALFWDHGPATIRLRITCPIWICSWLSATRRFFFRKRVGSLRSENPV